MTNPFRPGFGLTPAILAGRSTVVEDFERALREDRPGERNVLISGARGTGKTVLLTEFEAVAAEQAWTAITLHTASTSLMEELRAAVVNELRRLDPDSESSRLTGGGVSGVSANREIVDRYQDEQLSVGVLVERLAVLTDRDGGGLLLTLDEVQSVDRSQLRELTQHVQDLARRSLPVGFVAAGVRTSVDELLDHEKTTFLRRAQRVELGSVPNRTAAEAIRQTVADTHKTIAPEAAARAGEISQGYPYLIQLVGARSWDHSADSEVITVEDVESSQRSVIGEMIKNVHGPALRGLSGRKMDYLLAMLEDDGPSRVGEIAERMGVDLQYQGVYRGRLIEQELIRPAGLGRIEFALPYLREAIQERRPGGEGRFTTNPDERISRSRRAQSRTFPRDTE